jgi:TonB family protein
MAAPAERLGRYTLVRSLGSGGMGELFLARADGIAGFAKLVALKRIVAHNAASERHVRMLLNEARLVASLQHPNIAQVYDVGVERGEYFFAMEYVHGQDLQHVLRRAPDRRLQLENCLHVAIGICAGLHHAHEARDVKGDSLGIVHRDVSPGNVLVSYDGAVKLVDFGVAKASTLVSETREGMVKGKYGYMSPEQCLGGALDRRSDLFAIGILLWEMAVGRRLYKIQGELATLQRVVYVDAPPPSRYARGFPPELERIIMRALARDPAQRYETAEQLQLDLERFAVEHRLSVSAVAMSHEMNELFKDRIDAWREAERMGRSLADHLADAEPADALISDELDGVIGDLHTNVFTPQSIAASPLVQPARRSRTWLLVALVLLLGVAAAATVVFGVGTHDVSTQPLVRAEAPSVVVMTEVAAVEPEAEEAAVNDAPEAVAPDAPETVEPTAPAPVEPEPTREPTSEPQRTRPKPRPKASKPHAKPTKHAPVRVAERPVDNPAPAKREAEQPAQAPPRDEEPATASPKPGSVDANAVRAVVRTHLAEIQACVSRARMDDRDLKGRITMRIDISPSGSVTGTSVASSTGATPTLEACMRKAVATWSLPAPAGGVAAAIRYPFVF